MSMTDQDNQAPISEAPAVAEPAARTHFPRWKRMVGMLLVVIASVLAPLSIVIGWAHAQLFNTDAYVRTITPLATNPDVQQAVAHKVATEVDNSVNLTPILTQAFPKHGAALAGPIKAVLVNFIQSTTLSIVKSPGFVKVWVNANRAIHQVLANLLLGQGKVGKAAAELGKVSVNIAPAAAKVKQTLESKGFPFLKGRPLTSVQLTLIQNKGLEKAQSLVRFFNKLVIVLPILAILLYVGSLFLTSSRRRAVIRVGIGLAIGSGFVLAAIAYGRSLYLSELPASASQPAAAAIFDIIIRGLRGWLRLSLGVGLLLILGAFLAGPSAAAVRIRSWVRRPGDSLGPVIGSNEVARWVAAHWRVVDAGAVVVGGMVLLLWSLPTPVVVLVIGLIVLVIVLLVLLVRQSVNHFNAVGAGAAAESAQPAT